MFLKFSFQPSWLDWYRWDLTVFEPKRLRTKKISLPIYNIAQNIDIKTPAHHRSPYQCATFKSSVAAFS
jgi:hypothetical protein